MDVDKEVNIRPSAPIPIDLKDAAIGSRPSQAPIQKVEGDVALVVMMGGTSARAVLATRDILATDNADDPERRRFSPPYVKVPWEEFRRLPQNHGLDIAPMADDFIRYFAQQTIKLMEGRVNPEQIKRVGLSVAGWTNGSLDNPRISTTNTGVEFKDFPFIQRYLSALFGSSCPSSAGLTMPSKAALRLDGCEQVNDGWAAALGEFYHPRGKLYGRDRGIALIVGTGVGGAAILKGERVAHITELGHTFWYNKGTKNYEYRDLHEHLIPEGYFVNGQWTNKNLNGYVYMEHRIAGPWNAILFVKSIINEEVDDDRLLLALCDALHERDPNCNIVPEQLRALDDLPQRDRAHWASKINDSVIAPINKLLSAVRIEHAARARYEDSPRSDLIRRAWSFKERAMAELGHAIHAIRDQFRHEDGIDFPIAIVGSSGEGLAQDRNFLPIVHGINGCTSKPQEIQVSCLTDIEREATFAARMLRG